MRRLPRWRLPLLLRHPNLHEERENLSFALDEELLGVPEVLGLIEIGALLDAIVLLGGRMLQTVSEEGKEPPPAPTGLLYPEARDHPPPKLWRRLQVWLEAVPGSAERLTLPPFFKLLKEVILDLGGSSGQFPAPSPLWGDAPSLCDSPATALAFLEGVQGATESGETDPAALAGAGAAEAIACLLAQQEDNTVLEALWLVLGEEERALSLRQSNNRGALLRRLLQAGLLLDVEGPIFRAPFRALANGDPLRISTLVALAQRLPGRFHTVIMEHLEPEPSLGLSIGPPTRPLLGRETVLERLHELLSVEDEVRCLLLTGPRGVGKTVLAQDFANELDFERENIYINPAKEGAAVWQRLWSAVHPDALGASARLLIVEAETEEDAAPLLPLLGRRGRLGILVLSSAELPSLRRAGASRLRLRPLSEKRSVELLGRLLGEGGPGREAELVAVARAADGFPGRLVEAGLALRKRSAAEVVAALEKGDSAGGSLIVAALGALSSEDREAVEMLAAGPPSGVPGLALALALGRSGDVRFETDWLIQMSGGTLFLDPEVQDVVTRGMQGERLRGFAEALALGCGQVLGVVSISEPTLKWAAARVAPLLDGEGAPGAAWALAASSLPREPGARATGLKQLVDRLQQSPLEAAAHAGLLLQLLLGLAELKILGGQREEALEDINRALSQDANQTPSVGWKALGMRSRIYEELGRDDKALEDVEQALRSLSTGRCLVGVEDPPSVAELHLRRCRIRLRRGDVATARASASEAARLLEPFSASEYAVLLVAAWSIYAGILLRTEPAAALLPAQRAVQVAEAALERAHSPALLRQAAEAVMVLGSIYLQIGQVALARSALNRLPLSLETLGAEGRVELVQLHVFHGWLDAREGQWERANEQLTTALGLLPPDSQRDGHRWAEALENARKLGDILLSQGAQIPEALRSWLDRPPTATGVAEG